MPGMPTPADPQLPGREDALRVLSHCLHLARSGRSASVVLVGDAGMGKTTLLEAAAGMAPDFRVLCTRGVPAESGTAFAGLSRLLGPVVPVADRVPAPQRDALLGALAMAPPAPADRLGPYVGMLSMLGALARGGPLLLLVDDVHRMDEPSVEALSFCARRLAEEHVAVVLAARPGEVRRLLRGVPSLELGPLDDAAALTLLARAPHGRALAPAVARRLLAAAAGNPLALGELPGMLTAGQRTGAEPLPEPLRPGDAVATAFGEQFSALPAGPRAAAVVAAASADGRLATIIPALRALDAGPGDLEAAEAAGVVEIGVECVGFRHPLLRGAVLGAADPALLRRAHVALSDAVDPRRDPERWVWHRAEAAEGPDAGIADALADVARDAGARAGFATAAATLARAAELTPDPARRGERLVAAAESALAAGRAGWARELGRRARRSAFDPATVARADLVVGRATITAGDLGELMPEMSDAAARTPDAVPRTEMLALAAFGAVLQDDPDAGLALARRALAAAAGAPSPVARVQAWSAYAVAAVLTGEGRALHARLPVVRAAAADCADEPGAASVLSTLSLALSWMELVDDAGRLGGDALEALRRRGLTAAIVVPLSNAAQVAQRVGRWDEAAALVDEAIALGREAGQAVATSYALATSARLRAGMGDADRCEADCGRALASAWSCGASAVEVLVAMARGLRAAGEGRPDEVYEHLSPLVGRTRGYGVGDALVVPWRSELIEAAVATGRRDEAVALLRDLAVVAHRSAAPTALAIVERCRGLVDAGEAEAHLRRALTHHARGATPFEEARTHLLLGTHLCRARRRADARPHLRRAREVFEALGAAPWAARARAELDAGRLRAAAPAGAPRLSAREREVARAVAEGATNREVAARMYLSDKTIERHLSSVYRKLGIRSRTQLARWFAAGGDDAAGAAPPG